MNENEQQNGAGFSRRQMIGLTVTMVVILIGLGVMEWASGRAKDAGKGPTGAAAAAPSPTAPAPVATESLMRISCRTDMEHATPADMEIVSKWPAHVTVIEGGWLVTFSKPEPVAVVTNSVKVSSRGSVKKKRGDK